MTICPTVQHLIAKRTEQPQLAWLPNAALFRRDRTHERPAIRNSNDATSPQSSIAEKTISSENIICI